MLDAGAPVADFAIDAGFAFGGTVKPPNDERAKLRRGFFQQTRMNFLQKERGNLFLPMIVPVQPAWGRACGTCRFD